MLDDTEILTQQSNIRLKLYQYDQSAFNIISLKTVNTVHYAKQCQLCSVQDIINNINFIIGQTVQITTNFWEGQTCDRSLATLRS